MKNNNKGFSLVELIVVIAIMAILAAVAVVGVSVYIPKAQQASDKQLVADIEYVLSLNAQSTPDEVTAGYIILTPDGEAKASGEFVTDVLVATYGENWAKELKLAYGEWTNDGLLQYVVTNADSAELIANSTYLTTATPDGLMSAVNNLTDAATDVIKNYGAAGKDVSGKLSSLLGDDFVADLNSTGVTPEDEEYETVISNMLVGHFAGVLNNAETEDVMQDEGIVGMMMSYATLYAYCETIGDTTTMAGIDSYLAGSTEMDNLTAAALAGYVEQNCSEEFKAGYLKYNEGDEEGNGAHGVSDINAALEIMGAVGQIAGTYTDAETLSNPDLYSSDAVSEQLNNYISAVKAVAKMDPTTLAALEGLDDNAVAIFISEDGIVSIIPNAANLAS